MRPTRQQTFMEIAQVVAKRSTCFRLNVGAVIVINDRIVSIGYNGAPPGHDHCAGNDCPGVTPGQCPTIHAEHNALTYLPTGQRIGSKDIYITHAPCMDCANLCNLYNVKRLFFETPYRYTDAVDMLIARGVEVYQVNPAGYVIRYFDKQVVEL